MQQFYFRPEIEWKMSDRKPRLMRYAKYEDLDYTPTHGCVDIRGREKEWGVPVSVETGRAMEADGLSVCWIYASIPEWAATPLIGPIAWKLSRLFTWPSRWWRWVAERD